MKTKLIVVFTAFFLVGQVVFAQTYEPVVKDVISPKTKYFSIQDVRLLDSPFLHAMNQNVIQFSQECEFKTKGRTLR